MSNYYLKLTPNLVNRNTEGSLDTSVNGRSIQRTGFFEFPNTSAYAKDGEVFDDIVDTMSDNANIVSTNYAFRIVDNTNNGIDKQVIILTYNREDDILYRWKRFIINNSYGYFNFFGNNSIVGQIGDIMSSTLAITGRKYSMVSNKMIDIGPADVGNIIQVKNTDTSRILSGSFQRNGNSMTDFSLQPGDTQGFLFAPTIWIYASSDLSVIPEQADVNTEISLLGVGSADIVVDVTDDVYSFSLSNIVYA